MKKMGEIFSDIFDGIERDTLNRIISGDREEKDHITSTIFTLFEERINNNSNVKGLKVSASQFRGRGPNSPESITGADGSVTLDVTLKDTEFRKHFIFQAKNFTKNNQRFDEFSIDQKHKMLNFTSDSFFLIYAKDKVCFVSAFLVGLNNSLSDLPAKTFTEFNKDFFNCFIGDHLWLYPQNWFHFPWRRPLSSFRHTDVEYFIERFGWPPIAKNNLILAIKENTQLK